MDNKIRKMHDIGKKNKDQTLGSLGVSTKPSVLRVRNSSQYTAPSVSLRTNTRDSHVSNIYPKKNKSHEHVSVNTFNQSKKTFRHKKLVTYIFVVVLVVYSIGFFVLPVYVKINPVENTEKVAESITLYKANTPFRSSVIFFDKVEELPLGKDQVVNTPTTESGLFKEDETVKTTQKKDTIKSNIENTFNKQMIYDIPFDYVLLPGCKSDIIFNEETTETKTIIRGTTNALVVHKKEFEEFILQSIKSKTTLKIKESNLSCSLRTSLNQNSMESYINPVSFIVSGDIVVENTVNSSDMYTMMRFKSIGSVAKELGKYSSLYTLEIKPLLPIYPYYPIFKNQIKIENN